MDKKKVYKSILEEIRSIQHESNNIDKRKANSELEFQEFAKSCRAKIKRRNDKSSLTKRKY